MCTILLAHRCVLIRRAAILRLPGNPWQESVGFLGRPSLFSYGIALSLQVAGAASFLPWRSSKLENKVRSLEQNRLEGRDRNLGALGIQTPRPFST